MKRRGPGSEVRHAQMTAASPTCCHPIPPSQNISPTYSTTPAARSGRSDRGWTRTTSFFVGSCVKFTLENGPYLRFLALFIAITAIVLFTGHRSELISKKGTNNREQGVL